MRKLSTLIVLSLCFIILSVTDVNAATCKEAGCSRTATSNRGYCSSHTCVKCNAHRITGSQYCYTHSNSSAKKSYDKEVSAKVEKELSWKKTAQANNKKTCKEPGCYKTATSNRGYCSSHTCLKCNAHRVEDSSYCLSHSPNRKNYSSESSKNSHSSSGHHYYYDSYDDGYEDIWLDDDYDEDRYYSDSDYAAGVDDAMDEFDW